MDNNITWVQLLGLIATILGLIATILIALGIVRRVSTAKERMRKKILRKLNELANKDDFLVPEIQLRDTIYRNHAACKPLSVKRFFGLFIESIRELTENKEIIRINRGELFCSYPHPSSGSMLSL